MRHFRRYAVKKLNNNTSILDILICSGYHEGAVTVVYRFIHTSGFVGFLKKEMCRFRRVLRESYVFYDDLSLYAEHSICMYKKGKFQYIKCEKSLW